MTVAALSAAVQARYGAQHLIELTNSVGTATSINTTVLEAACADSIGAFERVVAVAHDTSNASHLGILVSGAIMHLEIYRSRDSNFVAQRTKDFFGALTNFRKMAYVPPSSNSNLTHERETSGTRPDMDRNRAMWGGATSPVFVSTIDP